MLNQTLIEEKSLKGQTYSSLDPLSSSKALPKMSPKTDPEDLEPYFSNKLCSSSISNCLIDRANFRFVRSIEVKKFIKWISRQLFYPEANFFLFGVDF